jgi:hypothetical protein
MPSNNVISRGFNKVQFSSSGYELSATYKVWPLRPGGRHDALGSVREHVNKFEP